MLVVALVASLGWLVSTAERAGASAPSTGVSVALRYGCGHGERSFVEVMLTPGAGILNGSEPGTVQVGLATSPADDDLYPDGGPTLVSLVGGRALVRLAGPVTPGQHVFVRSYGSTAFSNYALPATCRDLQPTEFGLTDPDVYGSRQVNCIGSTASLKLTVQNNNDSAVGYTVLLVRRDGRLSGTQPQGLPVPLAADSRHEVTLEQPGTKVSSRYQVRVIAPDGLSVDVAEISMQCDTVQPGPHPSVTPTLLPPPTTSAGGPTGAPSSRPAPPTSPEPVPQPSPTSTQLTGGIGAPGAVDASDPAQPSATLAGRSSVPDAGSSLAEPAATGTAAATGAPVLGAAATTTRPVPVTLSPSSPHQVVEAQRIPTISVSPGFTGAAALVLFCFAGATGALLAAGRASTRRR